jgi:hypothetical protein
LGIGQAAFNVLSSKVLRRSAPMDRPGFGKPDTDSEEVAASAPAHDWGDDWVHELIAMTRPGVEINWPVRGLRERVIPFEFDDFN